MEQQAAPRTKDGVVTVVSTTLAPTTAHPSLISTDLVPHADIAGAVGKSKKLRVRLPTAPPTIKHKTRPPRNVPVRETAERRSAHPTDCECFFCIYDRGLDNDDAEQTY